jgi:hypothetical protein
MKHVLFIVATASLMACSGSSGPAAPSGPGTPASPQVPAGAGPVATAMFRELADHIASALAENRANLPRNPQIAAQINAKIGLLQNPALAAEMSNGRFFVEGSAASVRGSSVAIAAVFPEERLRFEAGESVRVLERALPLLESFLDTPFPNGTIQLWYGFKIGNSGGGARLFMEDRTTYEIRTPTSRLPYDAILGHELAHTYILNEALTQFLELYVYNSLQTGSPALTDWIFTRGYVSFFEGNQDSAALIDIYQWIGREAMARAYKAAVALRPPYGEPLSAACRQVFVNEAPDAMKTQVADRIARVTF